MHRLGQHALVDVGGISRPLDETEAGELLIRITEACGATLLMTQMHRFGEGDGLTAIAILAESHISLHEWPEHEYVAFDIFVCGRADPERGVDVIREHYPHADVNAQIFDRGL